MRSISVDIYLGCGTHLLYFYLHHSVVYYLEKLVATLEAIVTIYRKNIVYKNDEKETKDRQQRCVNSFLLARTTMTTVVNGQCVCVVLTLLTLVFNRAVCLVNALGRR